MRYFSYGSNMSLPRLQDRVSEAKKVGVAELESYQLRFHKVSKKDGSGKCDAFNTGDIQDRVIGVLYDLPEEKKPILDKFEGLGFGYKEQEVKVLMSDGATVTAFTYIATNIDQSLKPFDWYKEHVVHGAKTNGLPDTYVGMLNAVECKEDPDSERRDRELAIYR